MALVNVGVRLNVKPSKRPAGWSPTQTDYFPDWLTQTREWEFDVDKATVAKTTETLTFQEILDNITIGVLKQIEDKIALNNDLAKDLVYWVDIRDIKTNCDPLIQSNNLYTDTATKYTIRVRAFIRTLVLA